MKYWKASQNDSQEPELTYWWYRPNSADTETTAYALLTMLNMIDNDQEKISMGLPYVRWLTTQRNPWGGFGSTQVSTRISSSRVVCDNDNSNWIYFYTNWFVMLSRTLSLVYKH